MAFSAGGVFTLLQPLPRVVDRLRDIIVKAITVCSDATDAVLRKRPACLGLMQDKSKVIGLKH